MSHWGRKIIIASVSSSLSIALVFPLDNLLIASSVMTVHAQAPQRNKSQGERFRMVEPNLYSPELYADKLSSQFTLVNLPGASNVGSRWEVSYRLYFIPETEYWKVMRSGQYITDPDQFPEKMLLANGRFSRANLSTIKNRTYIRGNIDFKAEVSQKDQTKFAMLMMSYAVKVYDARLKTSVYESNMFLIEPFADDPNQPDKAVPRTTLYTNFVVTPKGQLFASQLPHRANDMDWGK